MEHCCKNNNNCRYYLLLFILYSVVLLQFHFVCRCWSVKGDENNSNFFSNDPCSSVVAFVLTSNNNETTQLLSIANNVDTTIPNNSYFAMHLHSLFLITPSLLSLPSAPPIETLLDSITTIPHISDYQKQSYKVRIKLQCVQEFPSPGIHLPALRRILIAAAASSCRSHEPCLGPSHGELDLS